ncbi:hypothetical protein LOC67_07035 [Stieleria sp. JC731]|nr:hypothetical protein [Stieleria sp. JC731]MCC9600311.1 hypothetical protein [Stieleria sp. JC731]
MSGELPFMRELQNSSTNSATRISETVASGNEDEGCRWEPEDLGEFVN